MKFVIVTLSVMLFAATLPKGNYAHYARGFSLDGKRWDPSSDFNFDRKTNDQFKIELHENLNRKTLVQCNYWFNKSNN